MECGELCGLSFISGDAAEGHYGSYQHAGEQKTMHWEICRGWLWCRFGMCCNIYISQFTKSHFSWHPGLHVMLMGLWIIILL